MPLFTNLQPSRLLTQVLSRRHRDFQNAIVECRRGIAGVGAFRHWKSAIELSVTPFAAIKAFAFFFLLALAFTFDRNRIVRDFDLHIVFG